MSAGKKKIPQAELRRLMSQHKTKLPPKKVHSAVAKYTETGKLTCTICSISVSESLWDLHKKSREHLEFSQRIRVEVTSQPSNTNSFKMPPPAPAMKPTQIKSILKNAPKPVATPLSSAVSTSFEERLGVKRRASEDVAIPAKMRRGKKDPNLPDNFFDESSESKVEVKDVEMEEGEEEVDEKNKNIPEGFFDDPMLDAKARNIEYKNPVEEEWEKFQREMKEETSVSAQIIAEDQDEATVERQIDEIDEQMRNWSRVLNMERQKDRVKQELATRMDDAQENSSSGEEDEFVEFVDWRLKKAYK